jgi:hypothetical protein
MFFTTEQSFEGFFSIKDLANWIPACAGMTFKNKANLTIESFLSWGNPNMSFPQKNVTPVKTGAGIQKNPSLRKQRLNQRSL